MSLLLALMLAVLPAQSNEAALRQKIAELEAQLATLKAQLPKPAASKAIATWKGSGLKDTETFTTTKGEFRVKWKAAAKDDFIYFSVMVRDGSNRLVGIAGNVSKSSADTSIIRGAPGRYYLSINAAGADWEVTVEE